MCLERRPEFATPVFGALILSGMWRSCHGRPTTDRETEFRGFAKLSEFVMRI